MLLSSFHYEILQHISEHEFIQGTELEQRFPNMKMRYQNAIQLLLDQKLIHYTAKQDEESYLNFKSIEDKKHFSFDPVWHLFLTEYGYSVLETYQKEKHRINLLEKQVDTNCHELDVQKESLRHLKSESENSKKDVRFSKVMSLLALIVSLAAIIIPQITGRG